MSHPQLHFDQTRIEKDSFIGKLRKLYATEVLSAQLAQLKKTGRYDAFKLKWHKVYGTPGRRSQGGSACDNVPPSLFWESDIGKWIEASCYFLMDPDTEDADRNAEFLSSIEDLIQMIKEAQHPDGYLNIYFTVVDPKGRWKNLRDLHELYNAGHLLEGALAHFKLTGRRDFLDIMIRNIDCIRDTFGPKSGQLHGYPGHPGIELALLRLHAVTGNVEHRNLALYFLKERGKTRSDLGGQRYFHWEAKQRSDARFDPSLKDFDVLWYFQAHKPLLQQKDILGHSVRAFYLLTAAADAGGELLEAAKRLYNDAITTKMYVTGGFGSISQWQGFPEIPFFLPTSMEEAMQLLSPPRLQAFVRLKGGYAETCASIAAMMVSERLLSHHLDVKYRDIMELCFFNTVIGGASLDGKSFSYGNRLASSEGDGPVRTNWFEAACCPPNLSRTLGLIGGYTWRASVQNNKVELAVYLYNSASMIVSLPNEETVTIQMSTLMPWQGEAEFQIVSPANVSVAVKLPIPGWARSITCSVPHTEPHLGYITVAPETIKKNTSFTISLPMPVRLLAPNPGVGQDVVYVTRGPMVYVAEDIDNQALASRAPHFRGIGLLENAKFTDTIITIAGFEVTALETSDFRILEEVSVTGRYRDVADGKSARLWAECKDSVGPLKLVPFFSRGNRGGGGMYRVPFMRIMAH